MSTPLPNDPLDDLITNFDAAVDRFLDRKDFAVGPPEMPDIQGPSDILLAWGALKRQLGQMHKTWVRADPEVKERLQEIISLGSEILVHAEDPFIVGPVNELARLAAEEQSEISNVTVGLGNVDSFPAFLLFLPQLISFGIRNGKRRKAIAATRDSLTAYYVLQMPPREPDDPAS